MVIEPPGRTQLHLARAPSQNPAAKIAKFSCFAASRGYKIVLGSFPISVKRFSNSPTLKTKSNHPYSRIRRIHCPTSYALPITIQIGTDMKLHNKSMIIIELPHMKQKGADIAIFLLIRQWPLPIRLFARWSLPHPS